MIGYAGSPTHTVYVGVTLTRSKVKVSITGLLNFRQLAKPCMLAAMTAAPCRAFWLLRACCGQTAGWIKMRLGAEVNLCRGDVVLDGVSDPPKRGTPPVFCPCLLWPNGWMDEDATWYGSRPRFRPYCRPATVGQKPPSDTTCVCRRFANLQRMQTCQ